MAGSNLAFSESFLSLNLAKFLTFFVNFPGSLIFKYPILTGVRFCTSPNGIKGKQKSENKKINHKNEKDPLREKVSASEESRKLHFILYNLLTGFFGVGGGFAIVPALTIVLGLPMGLAGGTSLLVILLNSATGVLGRLGTPLDLDWALIAVFTTAAVVGSLVGERVGRRLDPRVLQRGFAVMLVLVAVYTGVSNLL